MCIVILPPHFFIVLFKSNFVMHVILLYIYRLLREREREREREILKNGNKLLMHVYFLFCLLQNLVKDIHCILLLKF